MTRYLIATASVHTTAAASDYVQERATENDRVWVMTVDENGRDPRDGGDALNVARVRLGGRVTVEAETRTGDAGGEILAYAAEVDADEIVIGARSGDPGRTPGVGTTAEYVLTNADRPVVVVPLGDLA